MAIQTAFTALIASGKLGRGGRRLAQLVYWLPLIHIGLGNLHLPGAAPISIGFALYILRQATAEAKPVLPVDA
jgi:hypothetical protein